MHRHTAFGECYILYRLDLKIRHLVAGRARIQPRSRSKTVFTLPKLYVVDMSVYLENPRESIKNLSEPQRQLGMLTAFKITLTISDNVMKPLTT